MNSKITWSTLLRKRLSILDLLDGFDGVVLLVGGTDDTGPNITYVMKV